MRPNPPSILMDLKEKKKGNKVVYSALKRTGLVGLFSLKVHLFCIGPLT